MLFARRVVSPHPHARVKAIDTSAAERLPGVKAVHVVERNEGAKLRNPPQGGREVSAGALRRAGGGRRRGDDAGDRRRGREAGEGRPTSRCPSSSSWTTRARTRRRSSIPARSTWAARPAAAARPRGSSSTATCAGRRAATRATSEAAMKTADFVVEGSFHTQVQTHSALETHGVVADWQRRRPHRLRLVAGDLVGARRAGRRCSTCRSPRSA